MSHSVKKDYFWNTLGVFLQNLLSPLLLVVVSRLNGVEDAGLFSFTFAMAVSFSAISIWGNRTYQVSDIKNRFNSENYIASRILTSLLTIIMSVVFILANDYNLNKSALLLVFVSLKIIESICDVIYGIMQTKGKLYISGMSLSIKSVASLVLFGIIDFISKDILLSSVSIVVVNLLVVILFDLKYIKHINIKDKFNIREAINILKVSSPAFIIGFLSLLTLTVIRYFIDINKPGEIAYFGIFSMPITAIILIASFILQPNVLPLSKKYNYNKKSFYHNISRIIIFTLFMGIAATIIVGIIGDEVVKIIFNIDVGKYMNSLIIMVMGAVFAATVSIYSTIFNIMRKFNYHIGTLLITNIILVILCYFFKVDLLLGSIFFAAISFIQLIIMSYVLFIKLRYNKKYE